MRILLILVSLFFSTPVWAGTSLSGVVEPLAGKIREIVSACGSKILSAHRCTRVRGSGRISLHCSGRAVDVAGNPSCIYSKLSSWPGGYTIDYSSIRPNHVHISYGGNEHGLRFRHYGGKKSHRRHRR